MHRRKVVAACGIALGVVCCGVVLAYELNAPQLEALRPLHGVVGSWQGEGSSAKSSGWREKMDVLWGYREKDGRVSIEFHPAGNPIFTRGLLTYDAEKEEYQFLAVAKGDAVLRFRGKPAGAQTIRLDRAEEASDKLDRVEIKLLREGDKMLFTFSSKKGKTSFEQYAQTDLYRTDDPLDSFKNGPRCVVTGGAGRVEVDVNGEKFHVACENTKQLLLADPDRFAKKK